MDTYLSELTYVKKSLKQVWYKDLWGNTQMTMDTLLTQTHWQMWFKF